MMEIVVPNELTVSVNLNELMFEDVEKCSGSLELTVSGFRFASWRSMRNREMRMAVILRPKFW